jgi:aldehyde:ferredoxin oxidoreductase
MVLPGQVLNIDLTQGTWSFSPFPEELIRKVLGGRGLNVWYLYQHLPARTDPLDPENILMFSCGLLTGTAAPASSRLHVNALSPLTGLLGSSNTGGKFGAALRACNIQTLIIRGRSPKPVFLYLDRDTVNIMDAQPLWGLDTWETEEYLKQEFQDDAIKFMIIGPGGENGARFGCIMTDRDHAAGRTGMGTMMGSKNLKAIVIKAQKAVSPPPAPPSRRGEINNGHTAITNYIRQIRNSAEFNTFSTYGGAGYVKWADDMGIMPTRNYRESHFQEAESLDGRRLQPYITRPKGCYRCPVQCKAQLQFQNGKFEKTPLARPEFESMLAFGPKCGLNDLETVVHLDNLCSRLGLDSLSAASTIAFAMDLYERGILTEQDTGALQVEWGNGEVMETLIRQMAYQEGFGAILAQGVRRAARMIGKGAEQFAPHVKGLELSAYHPRELMGTALGYAVSSRGGDFTQAYPTLEYRWSPEKATAEFGTPLAVNRHATQGKGHLVKRTMIISAVLDCLGLCKVPALSLIGSFDLQNEAELMSVLTGQAIDAAALFKIGERIVNLERLFNLKHGASWADDTLPPMFLDNASQPVPLEPMLQEFYATMGWDEQGRSLETTLQELEIETGNWI